MTIVADVRESGDEADDPAPAVTAAPAAGWRDFSRAWRAHGVSSFGDHFTMVALPLATFARTHSALAVGFAAAMEGLTVVLFGMFAGVMADRVRRRRLLVLTDVARAFVVGSLAVGLLWHGYPVGALFATAFVLGALRVAHDAAEAALVPILVAPRSLLRANSRIQATDSAATAAGPAIAGGLLALGGPPLAFAADAASFAVSAFTVRGLGRLDEGDRDVETDVNVTRATVRRDLREGLAALWRDSLVMRALVLLAAMNVVAIAAEAQFIPYARDVLHVSAAAVGAYFALGGSVAVVTAMVAGRRQVVRGDALVVGVGVFALGFLAAGVWPSLLTAAIAYACAGFGSALTTTHWYSLRHKRFPVYLLGRVAMVTRTAIMALVPVAYVLGGWFARTHGPDALFVAVAVIGIGAALWAFLVGFHRVRID